MGSVKDFFDLLVVCSSMIFYLRSGGEVMTGILLSVTVKDSTVVFWLVLEMNQSLFEFRRL